MVDNAGSIYPQDGRWDGRAVFGSNDASYPPEHRASDYSEQLNKLTLEAQATAALRSEFSLSDHERRNYGYPFKERVDSIQEGEERVCHGTPQSRRGRTPPLRLRTDGTESGSVDTIATSPTLRKYAEPVVEGKAGTLPALHPISDPQDGITSSPTSERLPSFRELSELAEVATQQDTRAAAKAHNYSQSLDSVASQSPMQPYPYYPQPIQTSPQAQYSLMSPRTTRHNSDAACYSSYQPTDLSYYNYRRASAASERTPVFPPQMPSNSSSGDSYGHPSSNADGYSTTNTTPSDPADDSTRSMPILPPPAGMPQSAVITVPLYRCDHPSCTAPPFQTQYLLSSHKNVHSSDRPHYCAVPSCPRSEGGKGFKRKNEMIRHGLVHNSPGYVCPFCEPEKEHRYPRPDNLQRHVKAHHPESYRNDPKLREVLAQRIEGAGKTRRRRTGTMSSVGSI